jgi:hypothetical protein
MHEPMSYPSYPYPQQYPFGVGFPSPSYSLVPSAPPRPPVRVVLPPPSTPEPNCIHVAWFVLVVLVALGGVGGLLYYLIR